MDFHNSRLIKEHLSTHIIKRKSYTYTNISVHNIFDAISNAIKVECFNAISVLLYIITRARDLLNLYIFIENTNKLLSKTEIYNEYKNNKEKLHIFLYVLRF